MCEATSLFLNPMPSYFIMNSASLVNGVTIAYQDYVPKGNQKGVIVLLHGFPQTSYQFRKVVRPLAEAG